MPDVDRILKRLSASLKPWTKITRPPRIDVLWHLFATLAVIGVCTGVWHSTQPEFGEARYRFNDGEWHTTALPFFIPTEGEKLDVEFTMDVPTLHTGTFVLKPDDCIESATINGVQIATEAIVFCDYGEGKDVSLGAYLHSGSNDLSFTLKDTGGLGGFKIRPSHKDSLTIALAIIGLAAVLQFLLFAFRYLRATPRENAIFLILLAGIGLRLLYVSATPWETRGHDTDAHIDYIEYIATNGTIPRASDGWEYHQPPLYYALMAIPMSVTSFLGVSTDTSLPFIQIVSLLSSILTLIIACRIGALLFPAKKDEPWLFLFCALCACFPSLVFLASRITNDVLFIPLGFAITYVLLRWWKSGNWNDWYILCTLSALAFITKNTALVYMAAVGACLLLHPRGKWRVKTMHAFGGALLILLLAGWYPVLRIAVEDNTTRTLSLGNMEMNDALRVPNDVANLLAFEPGEILAHPFNNPWTDDTRREFFLEYLFRSAFFGEFQFENTFKAAASVLLFHGLLALPFLAFGLFLAFVRGEKRDEPLVLLFLLFIAASFAYRIMFPFAPNQDFRFIVPILLPAAFFLCRGIAAVPAFLRIPAHGSAMILILLSTVFIATISVL